MNEIFFAINLKTASIHAFPSQRSATQFCLTENHEDPDHPAFQLYSARPNGEKAVYIGRLYRKFGEDFDKDNPWNMEIV